MAKKSYYSDKVVSDCYDFLHLVEMGKSSLEDLCKIFGIDGNKPESNYRQVERIKKRCMNIGIEVSFDEVHMKYKTETNAKLKYLDKVEQALELERMPRCTNFYGKKYCAPLIQTITPPDEDMELSEDLLNRLFDPMIKELNCDSISHKGVSQFLKDIYNKEELGRLVFIIKSLPTKDMRSFEITLINNYLKEIYRKLPIDHYIVIRGRELNIIRRPTILSTYHYVDRIFLAISERQLAVGNNNTIAIAEIADFEFLPPPSATHTAQDLQNAWNTTADVIEKFMQSRYVDNVHKPQQDIFYDNKISILYYDRNNIFINAKPDIIKNEPIRFLKGHVRNLHRQKLASTETKDTTT